MTCCDPRRSQIELDLRRVYRRALMNKTAAIGNRLARRNASRSCSHLAAGYSWRPRFPRPDRRAPRRGARFPRDDHRAVPRSRRVPLGRLARGLAFWDGYSVRSFEHEVGNAGLAPGQFDPRPLRRPRRPPLGRDEHGRARAPRPGHRAIRRAAARSRGSDEPEPRQRLRDRRVSATASLWVGTQEGLNRLDPRTRKFERLPRERLRRRDDSPRLRLRAEARPAGPSVDRDRRRRRRVDRSRDAPRHAGSVRARAGRARAGSTSCSPSPKIRRAPSGSGLRARCTGFDAADGALHHVALPELAPGKDDPDHHVDRGRCARQCSGSRRGTEVSCAYDPASRTSRGYRHDPAARPTAWRPIDSPAS